MLTHCLHTILVHLYKHCAHFLPIAMFNYYSQPARPNIHYVNEGQPCLRKESEIYVRKSFMNKKDLQRQYVFIMSA